MTPSSLPIWQIQGPLIETLRQRNRLVLMAPTGSGKTTQVPQMLLDAGLAQGKKVVVLQPRRVAARTVAGRVAWERGCPLGGEIGYQIRFEDRTSVGTRISYITEGILLRWLQMDRTLSDIGVLVFDEFHERNLLSDVSLALVKHLQESRRPELKIVVMSATLDTDAVAVYLKQPGEDSECPMLISEGRSFPVQVSYLTSFDDRPASEQAAEKILEIIRSGEPGDILVFMPGMAEINATIAATRSMGIREPLALFPLHGELPPDQQDLAFAPNELRKVVIATNVAETSVTIDGIRHVVDSGLARVARFDPERGIGTLQLEPISRASAEQRRGRAGRTAPGTCHRLWTENSQLDRPERNTPEIQRSDLAEVVLLLHSLGIKRAAQFDWLDRPDPQAVERAEKLLTTLGALKMGARDCSGSVNNVDSNLTEIGGQMLRLPMHPRYSRMLVEAVKFGCVTEAALCAALVSGRDLLMRLSQADKHVKEARESFESREDSDFYTLMEAYAFAKQRGFSPEACRRYGIHFQTARQIEQTYGQILDMAQKQQLWRPDAESQSSSGRTGDVQGAVPATKTDPQSLLRCIMAGFIDQLCIRRNTGTLECALMEGRQGTLMRESVVQNAPLFVAAVIREVSGRDSGNRTLVGLASAVQPEWLEETFGHLLSAEVQHIYDLVHKRIAAVRQIRIQDLVIGQQHQREVDPRLAGQVLAEAYVQGHFELPLFNHELRQFIARVNLIGAVSPDLEIPCFDSRAQTECLAKAFFGLTLAKEAQVVPLFNTFSSYIGQERLSWIDELAPKAITWHDGRRLKLLYAEQATDTDGFPNPPELQVKLTECFSLKEHPHICEGRLPVKLWLCSPDGKRVDSTTNWQTFKSVSYPKLRSALQKKFPGSTWY